MNAAKSSGWSYVPIASGATIVSIPLSVLLFAGFNYSVGASGEMKNARKSMFAGTIGALFFALIINIVGVQLGVNLVSYRSFRPPWRWVAALRSTAVDPVLRRHADP